MPLPENVDLRHLLRPVRDQGQRGTCLAFAVTAAHEAAREVGAPCEPLCVEMLHWASRQLKSLQFGTAAAALSQTGQPPEAAWPYDEFRDDTLASYAPPSAARNPGDRLKATLVRTTTDVLTVKGHLHAQQPVLLELRLCYGFHWSTNGTIPLPAPQELLPSRHAVLAVGYDDSQGAGAFLIRNSWGAKWGDGGYGRLPYGYLALPGASAWLVDSLL